METSNKYSKNNKTEYSFDLCKNKYLEQSSDIVPCPGGCLYKSIQSEINFRDSNSFLTEDSTSSLNVRQSKLIKNNDVDIDDILQSKIKCPNLYKSLEKQDKYDKIRVCGIVISTVMKIAKQSYTNITTEHVKCTESYFNNLKGKNGHPNNISKILQIIENLKNSESEMTIIPQLENDKEEETVESDKPELILTDVNRIEEIEPNVDKKSQEVKEIIDIYDFEPILYFFKIFPISFDNRHYQDHVFGVIWLLFSKKQKKSPSIPQLHWCLTFLQELKNRDGTYTNDINLCIQTIQDNLIEQYIKLGISLKDTNENMQDHEQLMSKSTSLLKHNEPELINTEENKLLQDEIMNDDKIGEQSIIDPQKIKQLDDIKTIPNGNTNEKLIESTNDDFNLKSCGKSCERKGLLKEHAPKIMSLTYSEMLSRGSFPCIEEMNHQHDILLETCTSFGSFKKFMKDSHLSKESIASMNKKQLIELFNNMRKKYVETIKEQVEKLCNLENFMRDIDKQSFKAYITDDLIKRLNELGNSDIKGSMESLLRSKHI
ncbi:hypothetical protein M0804_010930 [Polistes exclamans]|nr:hypothetical protein M0804_010930 [Polistes exclamans]